MSESEFLHVETPPPRKLKSAKELRATRAAKMRRWRLRKKLLAAASAASAKSPREVVP